MVRCLLSMGKASLEQLLLDAWADSYRLEMTNTIANYLGTSNASLTNLFVDGLGS